MDPWVGVNGVEIVEIQYQQLDSTGRPDSEANERRSASAARSSLLYICSHHRCISSTPL